MCILEIKIKIDKKIKLHQSYPYELTEKVYYYNHLSTATRFKCGNVIEVLPVNRFHSSCIIDVLLRCSIEFFCVTL